MFDGYVSNPQSPTAPPAPPPRIRFDPTYIKSLPGILKIVQLALNLLGFICMKVSWAFLSSIFYNILYWLAMLITLALLMAYACHFVEKYERIPWLKLELFYCGGVCLCYIVLSIIATTIGENGYAVGFFGFCAIIAYGFDGYLKYKTWKSGLPPQ